MSAAITLLARFLAAVVAVFTLLESSAEAQEKLKIGIITTLSGATGAVPGQQQRNGFELSRCWAASSAAAKLRLWLPTTS
jgi:hypothetical protein